MLATQRESCRPPMLRQAAVLQKNEKGGGATDSNLRRGGVGRSGEGKVNIHGVLKKRRGGWET